MNDLRQVRLTHRSMSASAATMNRFIPLVALAALASCNKPQPEVVDTRAPDPNAAAIANAAPVELPPAIKSQKTYRCKDNSLAYVTWYVGGKQLDAKTVESDPPTRLESATGTSPWTSAASWTLSGDETDITLSRPGKAAQSCHV